MDKVLGEFKVVFLGKLTVYQDRVEITSPFKKEVIHSDKIANVSVNKLLGKLVLETTGGSKTEVQLWGGYKKAEEAMDIISSGKVKKVDVQQDGSSSRLDTGWNKLSKTNKIVAVAVLIILPFVFINSLRGVTPQPQPTTEQEMTFKSPDKELLFEIYLLLGVMRQSKQFTPQEDKELASVEVVSQDVWNEGLGYSIHLSPPTARQLSDFQVMAILTAIQKFREKHNDKFFDVNIFDDPAIAKTARANIGAFEDVSEDAWCKEIFSHHRGVYSWNPTNGFEQVNLNINCNWVNILKVKK